MLKLWHVSMDTDIDKWDVIYFEKPENLEYWKNSYCFEVDSCFDFIDYFESKIKN